MYILYFAFLILLQCANGNNNVFHFSNNLQRISSIPHIPFIRQPLLITTTDTGPNIPNKEKEKELLVKIIENNEKMNNMQIYISLLNVMAEQSFVIQHSYSPPSLKNGGLFKDWDM
jgi:hypothetical protein